MNLKETYNRIALEWHKDHSDDGWWKEGTDRFAACIGPGKTVLDVGCGSGVKTRYLADKGLQVSGIDISENLLAIAKSEVPEADFRELSMTELDSLTETYGGIFAQASLLHIPKREAAQVIAQMARRLDPGGCLYIAVKERRLGEPEEAVVKEDDYGFPYERFFSYYAMEELEGYLQDAGLDIAWKDARSTGKTVWLQILGRKP